MKKDLIEWVERGNPIHLSVFFPTEAERRGSRFVIAAVSGSWVFESDLAKFWESPLQLRNVIRQLVRQPTLVVSEELQQILDSSLYNVTLCNLFAALWSARFDFCEGSPTTEATLDALVRKSLSQSLEGSPWVFQDVVLFWLTLAHQNGLVQRVVVSVPVDAGQDVQSLDHLHHFILSAERWAALGSPVRLLVGLVEGSHAFDRMSDHPLSPKLQESLL